MDAKEIKIESMTITASAVDSLRSSRPLREAPSGLWGEALRQKSVWLRAVKLGLSVGLLQASINQGDHWWHGEFNSTVVTKSIISPMIGFTLVLFSAAQTWVQRTLEQNS